MNFQISASRGLPAIVLTTGLLLSGETFAAGFAINDVSMTGVGRAFAGAGVVGDDYSAIAFNPAGITLKGTGAQAGAVLIWEHGQVKGSAKKAGVPGGKAYGKDDISIPVGAPNMFAQYKLNDDFTFGVGIYAPLGLATKYKDNWFGSDYGVTSFLEAIDIAPTLGYKMNEHWSFGLSAIARWGHVKMTNTSAGTGYSDFDIDGWNVYGRVGVMYEHDENTRIGLSYSSVSTEVEHTLKDSHTFFGMPGPMAVLNGEWTGGTEVRLPEMWLLSGYHKHGDFGYSAAVRYTRWEYFNDFTLTSSSPLGYHTSKYNWHNTWSVSLGVDWFYNDTWTFRAGLGYDESPVRHSELRTVRIPDNDRVLMSLGFTYKINDHVKMDVGYSHLYLPTFKARNGYSKTRLAGVTQGRGDVDVKYDFNAEVIGIQFQYDL
ncbi:MAG: outer membrane protein transport protein [Alphaproteobacteria bacterium]|nr:outer membrane protein transport protein [Alphaproteobacteria bacterium]